MTTEELRGCFLCIFSRSAPIRIVAMAMKMERIFPHLELLQSLLRLS